MMFPCFTATIRFYPEKLEIYRPNPGYYINPIMFIGPTDCFSTRVFFDGV